MANHFDLEEQEQLDQLKHFWKSWGGFISAVIFISIFIVAGWNMYGYWKNRQAVQASMLLELIKTSVASGDLSRVDQAFSEIKTKSPKTIQAAQAGLLVAKFNYDKGDVNASKSALLSVINNSSDVNQKVVANLRLISILFEEKNYDEAFEKLSMSFPGGFEGLEKDRRADLMLMQENNKDAIYNYLIAYKKYDDNLSYRKLIEFKLNSLGISNRSFVISDVPSAGILR
ncbi:MAG: tetratricopeptide repeat protein [Acinetobacter towneri]|nr:tetratricopeptide repeat protein [Acinetobacter towneri]